MLVKQLLFGYYDTQCLAAITKLNIAEHLHSGPKPIAELAQLTQSHADKLYRVMRFLSARGLFDELPDKTFQLNKESEYLVTSNPEHLNRFVFLHSDYFYHAISELTNSLSTDTTSFELKFGKLAGAYFRENADASEVYNTAMRENSELYGDLIGKTYNFSAYKTIVDVGGGIGSLLANLLMQYPNAHGINFDIPELQPSAEAYFKEKGVASRCEYIGGDFLKSVPAGGDIYMMKAVIHGRNDASAIEVLTRCKEVLPAKGKLLIIERIICSGAENYTEACLNDINMLNATRGHVRTQAEFKALLEKAGFVLTKVYPLHDALSIIEAEKGTVPDEAS